MMKNSWWNTSIGIWHFTWKSRSSAGCKQSSKQSTHFSWVKVSKPELHRFYFALNIFVVEHFWSEFAIVSALISYFVSWFVQFFLLLFDFIYQSHPQSKLKNWDRLYYLSQHVSPTLFLLHLKFPSLHYYDTFLQIVNFLILKCIARATFGGTNHGSAISLLP